MIDTTFLATSEKLCGAPGAPSPDSTLGGPLQFRRHEVAEERLDRQPAFLGAQVAAHGLAAFGQWIVSVWLASS